MTIILEVEEVEEEVEALEEEARELPQVLCLQRRAYLLEAVGKTRPWFPPEDTLCSP